MTFLFGTHPRETWPFIVIGARALWFSIKHRFWERYKIKIERDIFEAFKIRVKGEEACIITSSILL